MINLGFTKEYTHAPQYFNTGLFFILTFSENKPKWKSLFNGKDLKGWEVYLLLSHIQ